MGHCRIYFILYVGVLYDACGSSGNSHNGDLCDIE